jgi:hypothetical protein
MWFKRPEPVIEGIVVAQSQTMAAVSDNEKSGLENVTAYSDSQDNVNFSTSRDHVHGLKGLVKRLEIEKGEGHSSAITNVDLLPVPPEQRNWGFVTCEHNHCSSVDAY